jgi:F-type H+-transporting ATPase subunit b
MESIISTFHIDWKIIIAQVINFGIVFVVLYIYALKPLSKLMAERSEKIAQGITDAKSNADVLSQTQKEYEETLRQARAEAQKVFEEGKKEALVKKEKMLSDAKIEVNTMIENGKKALEAEKVKMVDEAKNELASLAILAAEKIMVKDNK